MGLYNVLFGVNPDAPRLLGALGLTEGSFYRYRDAYLTRDDEIAVYTRGGGGNRDCYCREYGIGADEATVDLDGEAHAASCVVPIQEALRQHPLYSHDEDDEFDCTYARFFFRIPDEARAILADVEPQADRDEVWQRFLSALAKHQ